MTLAHDLAAYAHDLRYRDLGERTVREAKRRFVDMAGCALGGLRAEPVRMARDLAPHVRGRHAATIFGTNIHTTPEWAAFANTMASRYLDFMDTYFFQGEYVHPEDTLAGILAIAEAEGSSGKEVITAAVLAYEVATRFVDFANIRMRGWDHVIWITLAETLAAAYLHHLSEDKTAQALAIAASSNIPLRQIRIGGLSMWKAGAVAYASQAGIMAAHLAGKGMTGTTNVFEGSNGFFRQVTGKSDFPLRSLCRSGDRFRIHDVHIKKYPAEINSQSAIDAALLVRSRISPRMPIRNINITTFTAGYQIIADPAKWYPANRETADHSLPYIVAAALADGEITERQFSPRRINDPRLRALVRHTTVRANRAFDREYYPGTPTQVTVILKSGTRISEKVVHPRGFCRNKMTDGELEMKFRGLARKHVTSARMNLILRTLWHLEHQKKMKRII